MPLIAALILDTFRMSLATQEDKVDDDTDEEEEDVDAADEEEDDVTAASSSCVGVMLVN